MSTEKQPNSRVLIVDDDPNVLNAYQRRLRKHFDVETALCSEEGQTALSFLGPFAVVVSDMQMPRESGARFLERVLEVAPDSVRIMLTGNADQATAAAAINQGRVFQFLNKPCEAEELTHAISLGIEEYHRRVSQRDELRATVLGAIEMMTHVIAATNPAAHQRALRLRALVAELCKQAPDLDAWELETAALLSQLGWITGPGEREGGKADKANRLATAANLISEVPRLERVAQIVRGSSRPAQRESDDTPLAALAMSSELLRMAARFDHDTTEGGAAPQLALDQLGGEDSFDKDCLEALRGFIDHTQDRELVTVAIAELRDGMILADDVLTTDGALLVAKNQEITSDLRSRLARYRQTHSIREPIRALGLKVEALA